MAKCKEVLKRGFTTNNVSERLALVGPHSVQVCKGYGTMGSLLSLAAQATIHCGDTWPQPWSGRQRIGRVAAAFTGNLEECLEVADDWRDEIARLRA